MFRFIACQQTLALCTGKENELVALDDDFFRSFTDLAGDDIEGVRIGVARFAGLVYGTSIFTCLCSKLMLAMLGNLLRHSQSIPSELLDLIHRLSQDPSPGVQSYVHVVNMSPDNDASCRQSQKRRLRISTFSRPPPPRYQPIDSPTVSPLETFIHRTTSECQPCCNGNTSTTQIPKMGIFSPSIPPPYEVG